MRNISFVKVGHIFGASLLVSICIILSGGIPASSYATNNLKSGPPSLPLYQYVDLADAIKIFNNPKAVIVDARPSSFYEAGHIERAVNLPAADVEGNMNSNSPVFKLVARIPKQAGTVMVYCSSSCGAAAEVAGALARAGVANVMIYGQGWPEWNACHLPSSGNKN